MPSDSAPEYANRVILAVLVLWMFLVRLYYEDQARHAGRDRPPASRAERILVALTSLWLVPAILYTYTAWVDPFSLALPDWARKTGAAVLSLAVLLLWWAHSALGPNWTPFLALRARHVLVTHGPYRWVRHPMYLANFVACLGMFLLTANWMVALVYFVPVAILYITRARSEEALLLRVFGDDYRAYMARTGRLLPKLRS